LPVWTLGRSERRCSGIYAPARAAIYRQTSQNNNLPSGFRDSRLNNLNAAQARSFDTPG
jgi:hypothetical protein